MYHITPPSAPHQVYYVVDKAPWFWKGGVGYITKDMVGGERERGISFVS